MRTLGTSSALFLALPMMACSLEASPVEPSEAAHASSSSLSGAVPSAPEAAGTYMFHIATPRGPEVGNWLLSPDGALYSVKNGAQIAAGSWTADAGAITLVRSTPYGNHCTLVAPMTSAGFATTASPSPHVACTWNRLRPNPPVSWYAVRLP